MAQNDLAREKNWLDGSAEGKQTAQLSRKNGSIEESGGSGTACGDATEEALMWLGGAQTMAHTTTYGDSWLRDDV